MVHYARRKDFDTQWKTKGKPAGMAHAVPAHIKVGSMALRNRLAMQGNGVYFVTTTVVDFLNVFNDAKCCELLIKNILYYQQRYEFTIIAYVIMPSHFHWITSIDINKGSISDIMRDIKKYSAWDIFEHLKNNNSKYLQNFYKAANPGNGQKMKFWMKRFDDEVIKNKEMLLSRISYIHNNPIKAGLVERPEEYAYSSARNYYGLSSLINVDISFIT